MSIIKHKEWGVIRLMSLFYSIACLSYLFINFYAVWMAEYISFNWRIIATAYSTRYCHFYYLHYCLKLFDRSSYRLIQLTLKLVCFCEKTDCVNNNRFETRKETKLDVSRSANKGGPFRLTIRINYRPKSTTQIYLSPVLNVAAQFIWASNNGKRGKHNGNRPQNEQKRSARGDRVHTLT